MNRRPTTRDRARSAARSMLAALALTGFLLYAASPASGVPGPAPGNAGDDAPAANTADVAAADGAVCPTGRAAASDEVPVLAHFYLWFTAGSWNRAKTDYPAIGRYASDQVSVMREQVAQAQAAGIDGFIVGWRSTEVLNERLAMFRDVAAEADFSVAITYQAQDFYRNPLPVAQVRRDLEELAASYADDPVFHVLSARPLVALSGTWQYSTEEVRSMVEPVADRLQVLATDKNLEGYQRLADVVDGELYYWSSADPQQTPGHGANMQAMADAVHRNCGVWVAPVAPGFDARLVGGRSVVDRRDGDTLASSWEAARASAPDVIGIISWNEFSENTHIEPSERHGTLYLEVLADLTGAPRPVFDDIDSSGPPGAGSPVQGALVISVVVGSLLAVGLLGRRNRRRDRS